MQNQQTYLYWLVLALLSGILLMAFGGGLFQQQAPWHMQWQHQLFRDLCHQSPDRSLWVNGQPMAVCSRCFGIYTGLTFGWILLPLVRKLSSIRSKAFQRILFVILALNILDVLGNSTGLWQNTLLSRVLIGYMLGNAVAFIFVGDFFNSIIKSTNTIHGRTTARDI